MPVNGKPIMQARARRERASARLDQAHAELKAEVLKAVEGGMTVVRAAECAGVSRQAVHDWIRDG